MLYHWAVETLGRLFKQSLVFNNTASLTILDLAELFIWTFIFVNCVKTVKSYQWVDIQFIKSTLL